LRILVACEESQTVTKELRALGHEAFSFDLAPCSGTHPKWKKQSYSLKDAYSRKYYMIIPHPPCTYLSHAGARWLYPKGVLNQDRLEKGMKAKELFVKLLEAPIDKIAIENPTPSKVYGLPPHNQVVQPYEFGDEAQKKTLLWTKGLPDLIPTDIVGKGDMVTYKSGKTKAKWFMDAAKAKTPKERARLRSVTFPGIAKAMALQWAGCAL